MNKIIRALMSAVAFASMGAAAPAWAQSSPSDFTGGARYDDAGRVTGTIAPDPDGPGGSLHYMAVRNTYDPAGRLIKIEKGELLNWQDETVAPQSWANFSVTNQVDTTYNALNAKLKEAVSAVSGVTVTPYRVTQYSYDVMGRLECTAIRMNPAAFASLPASACSLGVAGTQGQDRITRNVYDAAGRVSQVRKAVGTSLEQAYVTYGYRYDSKQEYVVDANGNKARMIYDAYDRQSQWQFPSATAPTSYNPSTPSNALATSGAVNTNDREEYGYDANNNRAWLRKRDGRVFLYGYDALNRLNSKVVPDACVAGYACTNVPASMTRDVYYNYDLRGLQTAARFDSASGTDAVLNAYDGFGRISSSTTSMGGTSRTLAYLYDADGNRTRITHPDGAYFDYIYDGLDRMVHADWWGINSGTVPFTQITYDTQGRRSDINRASSYTGYSYDGVSRLSGQSQRFSGNVGNLNTAFSYNAGSQITSASRDNAAFVYAGQANADRNYTVNGLNQYSSAGGVGFGYDSNGNLTASGSTAYTYDPENRLVVASTGAQLTYDPLGRLYQTYSPGTGVTRFLYDGDKLAAEYDGSGAMLRRYMFGPGVDEPILVDEGGTLNCSGTKVLHTDHQGSVIAQADCWGNRTAINTYDEYGIPRNSVNSNREPYGRFAYTGQAWIPELGMYYYKARIYSPTLGRFMQTDPIGYKDQINLYAYVDNDPLNHTDPSGLSGCVTYITRNAGGQMGVTTTTTWCDGVLSAGAYRALGVIGAGWLISKAEERDGSNDVAEADPREPGERSRAGKEVITGGEKPVDEVGIDKRGEGRKASEVISDAAAEAGVKPGKTKDGNPTVVFPDGSRATAYPESKTTGGPSIIIQSPKGRTTSKTREDSF